MKSVNLENLGVGTREEGPSQSSRKERKLTQEDKLDVLLEILERQKNGDKFASIVEAMGLRQNVLKNLFYKSDHPNIVDYKAKQLEEKMEVILNILERQKKDETFYVITIALHRPQQEI